MSGWNLVSAHWRLALASVIALAAATAILSILVLINQGPNAIYPGGDSDYTPIRSLEEIEPPVINPYFVREGKPIPVNNSPPTQIIIESIGVDAPVITLSFNADGIPQVPDSAKQVAWYDFSHIPGQGSNAVLAGHVSLSKQIGVFWGLKDLSPGDTVRLRTEGGNELIYRVFAVYLLNAEDPESVQVIEPAPFDVITLVTCGGQWRPNPEESFGGSFRDRIVVQANLLSVNGISYDLTPNLLGL